MFERSSKVDEGRERESASLAARIVEMMPWSGSGISETYSFADKLTAGEISRFAGILILLTPE
jgi:hypothetical protein